MAGVGRSRRVWGLGRREKEEEEDVQKAEYQSMLRGDVNAPSLSTAGG